jgi:glycolate oxidase iron-sulfur subunit
LASDSPSLELIQRCVHCGFCLPTCPTYAVLDVEMDSPRGRIRLMKNVVEQRIPADGHALVEHLDLCLGCRACETACPSGVEFGKLLEEGRALALRSRRKPLHERLVRWVAFRQLLTHPARLALFARAGWLAKRLGAGAVLRRLGGPGKRLAGLLELVPDRAPSSTALPASYPARGEQRGRVALFTGCVMRAAFAPTNAATARVLARNGLEVVVPDRQTCCGALHAHAGERDGARELARENIASLEALEVDAIVVNAAGCGAMLKEYGYLLKDDPAWHERAERFAARVRDASEHLAAVGLAEPPSAFAGTATYDDPCHLIHGQRVERQPRALLGAIPGLRLVELAEASWCCGSAGTYNVAQPELSKQLLRRKIKHVLATGADWLVTANPGCEMQLAAGLREARARTRVIHLMDLLDRAYGS